MTWFARLAAAFVLAFAPPLAAQEPATPATELVVIRTGLGDIMLALETERAPITAANFLRYADEHRFDGTMFYRAMRIEWDEQPSGLIQGGTQMNPERILPPIVHEPTNLTGIKHKHGTISMARYDPGTATGDFSIMVSDQPGLDADLGEEDESLRAGFAAFGHVVSGMEVVQAIFDAPVDPDKGEGWLKGQMLAEPVKIIEVRRAAQPRPNQ